MSLALPDTEAAAALVIEEAQLLDDGRWDAWLALYAEDCVFWVPAWRADGALVTNPNREVSHIYVEGKAGLADRITRIHSTLAASSVPLQRTARVLGASTAISGSSGLAVRTAWFSNVYFPRQRMTESFFGHYEHHFSGEPGSLRIARKKIVIKNDFIRTVLDFYFV